MSDRNYPRNQPSPIETAFWEAASPRIPGLQREVPIGRYRVDFLVPQQKVIIELYGYAFHSEKRKLTEDAQRERALQAQGYQIIRFTGQDIHHNAQRCVDEVLAILRKIDAEKAAAAKAAAAGSGAASPARPARAMPTASVPPSPAAKSDGPARRRAGMKAWQLAVIGGLGVALVAACGVFLMLLRPAAPVPAQTAPSPSTPTQPPLPTFTPRPTQPLLSTASALRVAECTIDWSFSWQSISPGRPATLTPPAGATCGIFNFEVSSGENPVIIFNNERYADLGSCLAGCIVRIRAVPVSIDVQGLARPDAHWSVQYYWNSAPDPAPAQSVSGSTPAAAAQPSARIPTPPPEFFRQMRGIEAQILGMALCLAAPLVVLALVARRIFLRR